MISPHSSLTAPPLTLSLGITIYNPGGVLGMECMDRSLEICVTSSVSEMAEVASAIEAWPNPFSDQTTIVFNSDSEISSVIICDVLGKVIKRISTNELKAGFHKIDLDLSDVQSGIYYCHLVSDNKVMSAKLIKN